MTVAPAVTALALPVTVAIPLASGAETAIKEPTPYRLLPTLMAFAIRPSNFSLSFLQSISGSIRYFWEGL